MSIQSRCDERLELAEIAAGLDRLSHLPPNWDHQGAKTITPDIIRAARRFIASLAEDVSRSPAVVPMAKGNLQFEWHDGPRTLELEIEDPATVHYLRWHPEEGIEDEGFFDISNVAAAEALLRWFFVGGAAHAQ